MEIIPLPNKIEIKPGENENQGILIVEPCFSGYGTTIGNALRRVLLSSLTGAAVTAVKIKGVQHEFSTIENVKEDVLEIILNLKLLRLKVYSDEKIRLKLNAKGEKEITAKDIEKNASVVIANPELHIATLTSKNAELEIELVVEKGRGYLPTEEKQKGEANEIGLISIDALFSPVKNVGLKIENIRVGQLTNFDKLMLTIDTDGTISPAEAVVESTKILLEHLNPLLTLEEAVKKEKEAGEKAEKAPKKKRTKKAKEE